MKTNINKNNFKMTLLMGSILSISAMFYVSNAVAQSSVGYSVNIETIGNEPGNLEPLKGFARDLPLITVLKQITPNGWVVKKEDQDNVIDVDTLVSWKGGENWIEVLDQISQNANFKAKVDWNRKSVTLTPKSGYSPRTEALRQDTRSNSKHDMFVAPTLRKVEFEIPQNAKIISQEEIIFNNPHPPVVNTNTKSVKPSANTKASSAVFELESGNTVVQEKTVVKVFESNDATTPAPMVVGTEIEQETITTISPLPKKYAGMSWTMDTSKTLKENVEAWGERAGYKVVWNGEDYAVDVPRTLHGEFDSNDGPIKQLALDYGPDSRVQSPLAFELYQNNILVVEEFRYEQRDYSQNVH